MKKPEGPPWKSFDDWFLAQYGESPMSPDLYAYLIREAEEARKRAEALAQRVKEQREMLLRYSSALTAWMVKDGEKP